MWSLLKRKAGVVLKSVDAEGNRIKLEYFIAVQVGDPEDYASHWTEQSMDAHATLRRVLNTKNAHDATETSEKGIVRKAVLEAEARIVKKSPKGIKPITLLRAIAKEESVIQSIKDHDAAAKQFVIGATRGADGSITKTQAAKWAIKALEADPEAFKAAMAKQGFEL